MAVTTCSNIWIRSGGIWKSAIGAKISSGSGWKDFKGVRSGDTWYTVSAQGRTETLLKFEAILPTEPDAAPIRIWFYEGCRWSEYWLRVTTWKGEPVDMIKFDQYDNIIELSTIGKIIPGGNAYTFEILAKTDSATIPLDDMVRIEFVYLNVVNMWIKHNFLYLSRIEFYSNTIGTFNFENSYDWARRDKDINRFAVLYFPYNDTISYDTLSHMNSIGYDIEIEPSENS